MDHEFYEQLFDENPFVTRRKFMGLAMAFAGGLALSSCGHQESRLTVVGGPAQQGNITPNAQPQTAHPELAPTDGIYVPGNAGLPAERGTSIQLVPTAPQASFGKNYYPGELITRIITNKNFMVWTFDDGPDLVHDLGVANVLRARGYEGKAGFPEVSNNALTYPQITRELHSRGFVIMNHTKTHAHYDGPTEASEIWPAQEDFYRIIGEYPWYFRAAGGTMHPAITSQLVAHDMCYWWTTGDEHDYDSPRIPDYAINDNLRKYIGVGYVSLRHTGGTHDNTVKAMNAGLDIMEQAGLTALNPHEALAARTDFDPSRRTQRIEHIEVLPLGTEHADGDPNDPDFDLAKDIAEGHRLAGIS